tara:strand:+ start:181 stop:936 length:756 start_codon:yes stop_codon:yes gene_type:complete
LKNLKQKIKQKNFNNKFSFKLLNAERHFKNIYKVCSFKFEKGCGSYLFNGKTYDYQIETYSKQKLLYEKSKNKKNILEIGSYMGHSLLIMLLANPRARITCIDINDEYSTPAINYIQHKFPLSKITFIKGSSLKVLKQLRNKFDFFHIDGAHKNKIVTKEFYLCMNIIKKKKIEFLFDDVDNIQTLIKNIKSTYKIINQITPNCPNKNQYIYISFPENKFIFYIKLINLKTKNLISYINLKFLKLISFKKL